VFWYPQALMSPDNSIPANPLVTPAHIVPEWYLLPFYAILRSVPNKLGGVIAMFGAIAVLFVLPWLDTSKVRSMRYRPTIRPYYFILFAVCIVLGWCGAQEPAQEIIPHLTTFTLVDYDLNTVVWLSRIAALYYFAYFLIIVPVTGLNEIPLPLPESISEPVLSHPASSPVETAGATKKG
jgi:ubiquinol-cytochrome c reductase cytochrome b subunit